MSGTDGAAFYRTMLTGDALLVFPFGVLDRGQAIEAIQSSPPWASFRLEDARIVQLTDESAVLLYRATAERAGDAARYSALISSVYVRQAESWKLAMHQQTPTQQP